MVQYQVVISVRSEVFPQYLNWLKTEHIKEVLETPGFLKAELLSGKAGSAVESSSQEVQVFYTVQSEEFLKSYLADRALKLREKGMEKFPGQFSAHRIVWKDLETFDRASLFQ